MLQFYQKQEQGTKTQEHDNSACELFSKPKPFWHERKKPNQQNIAFICVVQ